MPKKLLLLLCLVIPAISATPQQKLDKTVRHWQHVLRLDDWDIRAHYVPLAELPEGTLGASYRNPEQRVMGILVLLPTEYGKAAQQNGTVAKTRREITLDIEDTVIHELVHLRLRDLVSADVDGLKMAEEVAVARLTGALLAAGGKH